MSKKHKADSKGIVYSTNPAFRAEEESAWEKESLPAEKQKLRLKLETKHRGGKNVTLIENFSGNQDEAELLCKTLKNVCGTGGSVKDEGILIQGDNRDKILQWLLKNGYKLSRKI